MNKDVKAIVFDLGGVLLDLDFQKTFHAMSEVLQMEFSPENISDETNNLLADYEKGKVRTETLIWHLQRLNKEVIVPEPSAMIMAWNAMLVGFKQSKLDILKQLKMDYRLYLLSNTNELHLKRIDQILLEQYHIQDFEGAFFDKAYYSHLIGMRKPDPEIYHFVTQDIGISPEKILFIDDNAANISAAEQYGWQTILYDVNTDLADNLQHRLKFL